MVEQRNPYKGNPQRPWLRLQIIGLQRETWNVTLLADTGNPCALIIGLERMRQFRLLKRRTVRSNFGSLEGGLLRVAIPELDFDSFVVGYGSDAVAETASASSRIFRGLAGLPLLRLLEYGGNSEFFWLRRQTS